MKLDDIKARVAALRHDKGSWHADEIAAIVWGGPDTINDGRICDIRGWGHLTGRGALSLTPEEAAATQEARMAFIAHARTDVPALVVEVERLRAALDAERKAMTNSLAEEIDAMVRSLPSSNDTERTMGMMVCGVLDNLKRRMAHRARRADAIERGSE